MKDARQDALGRVLGWLLGAVGAFGLATLTLTIGRRIDSPYPLEWMEGASLEHALFLARGRLPYAAPSADFIAYLYPPLAYVPMAIASLVLGPSLPVARAVSVACTLGALALIGVASARLARSRAAGLLSAGLFALGFGYTGAFLDLVRVDAMFVLCIAAAAERLSAGKDRTALAWLAASALAKQHGAVLLLAVSAALLMQERLKAARAVAVAWAALLGSCVALQLASGGWFARYVLEVPSRHGLEPTLLASFVVIDLGVYLPVLTLALAIALAGRWRTVQPLDALTVAAIAVSALGRAHPGGDDNVRLPAFALLCVAGVAPLAIKVVHAGSGSEELGTGGGRGMRIAAALALCVQAAVLWQPPSLHAPHVEDVQRFRALEDGLVRCARGGRAVALDYARLNSTPFLHTMALSDLRLGGQSALANAGTRALLDALDGPGAPAAIAVGERFPELERALRRRYSVCAELPAPRPATGHRPGRRAAGGLYQLVYEQSVVSVPTGHQSGSSQKPSFASSHVSPVPLVPPPPPAPAPPSTQAVSALFSAVHAVSISSPSPSMHVNSLAGCAAAHATYARTCDAQLGAWSARPSHSDWHVLGLSPGHISGAIIAHTSPQPCTPEPPPSSSSPPHAPSTSTSPHATVFEASQVFIVVSSWHGEPAPCLAVVASGTGHAS